MYASAALEASHAGAAMILEHEVVTQPRACPVEIVAVEPARVLDGPAWHPLRAARDVTFEQLRVRGGAVVVIEEQQRAQLACGVELGDAIALDLEPRAIGRVAPEHPVQRDAVTGGGDEPGLDASLALRDEELERAQPFLDAAGHERATAPVLVAEVVARQQTERGDALGFAKAPERGECAIGGVRRDAQRIGAQRLEARERPVDVVRVVEVDAQRPAVGAELERPPRYGLSKEPPSRVPTQTLSERYPRREVRM